MKWKFLYGNNLFIFILIDSNISMMKFSIDFSKKVTWIIIAGLCGIGYLGVYTIQEMNAKDI